jgi:predicted small secreted protein
MKHAKLLGLGLLAIALVITGCNLTTTPPKGKDGDSAKKDDHKPHGKGPNGGVVEDLGKYHFEFTVDHDAKSCKIIILGNDEKTPVKIACTEITVITKEAKTTKDGKKVDAMTIKLEPKDAADGKASIFVGTDPGLGNVADFEGSVQATIDGKPSNGKFKE